MPAGAATAIVHGMLVRLFQHHVALTTQHPYRDLVCHLCRAARERPTSR
jgi:hypothetical protein